ncbi:cytochrome-c oxidase [Pseudomonas caspiana]|nr:cytochrome-c oxidase [Pseudomonas caspiana]TPG90014.1 cytochrome-c oxidase [Pseudomonas caspiana]
MNQTLPSSDKLKSLLKVCDKQMPTQLNEILKRDSKDPATAVKKFIALLEAISYHKIDPNSFESIVALHELVAPHDGAVASMMSIHFNLVIGTITNLALFTPYIKNLYEKLIAGRAIGVYLATELAHGNDLISIETQATYLPEKSVFVLNSGSKNAWKFMPNTTPCDLPKIAIVLANLTVQGKRYGIFPFLLPLSNEGIMTPGVTISPLGEKPGFHLDNAITSFTKVELPYEALMAGEMLTMSREGNIQLRVPRLRDRFALVTSKIHSGKLCMAISSVAMAKSALHITYRYAQQRKTIGSAGAAPIINYLHLKEGLAWDAISTVIHSHYLRSLCRDVSHAFTVTTKNFRFTDILLTELITAKSLCTWRTQETLIACRERCGAQGLFSENKIILYLISNFGAITAEGDNLVLSLKAGDMLLKNKSTSQSQPPIFQDLVSILQMWYDFLHYKLTSLSDRNEQSIQTVISNKYSDDIIALSQAWAVLNAAMSILTQHDDDDDDILLIAEGYLLDNVFRLLRSLINNNIISVIMSRAIEDRRNNYISQHANRICNFIDDFTTEHTDIPTPISSNNYIEWYTNKPAVTGTGCTGIASPA